MTKRKRQRKAGPALTGLELLDNPALDWQRRQGHAQTVDVPTDRAGVVARLNVVQIPLDRLLAKGHIDARQAAAGLRIRQAWHAAHQSRSQIAAYSERLEGGTESLLDVVTMAERNLRLLHGTLHGDVLNAVVNVCCYDAAPSRVARDAGLRADRGMLLLRAGLRTMADAWGL